MLRYFKDSSAGTLPFNWFCAVFLNSSLPVPGCSPSEVEVQLSETKAAALFSGSQSSLPVSRQCWRLAGRKELCLTSHEQSQQPLGALFCPWPFQECCTGISAASRLQQSPFPSHKNSGVSTSPTVHNNSGKDVRESEYHGNFWVRKHLKDHPAPTPLPWFGSSADQI